MDLLLLFIISICIFLGWYYTKYRETLAIVSKLPGPPRWPIFGNAFLFMGKSPAELLVKLTAVVEKYPKFTCLMLGPQPEILIMDPKLAEQLLNSQKLIDKAGEYDFLLDWIGTGLLTSTGNKWFQRRKIITPAFHFKILDQFVEVFDKHSNIFIQNLKKSNGKPVDVFELISLCALDNICETAMGIDIQAQIKSDSVYVKAVKEITLLLMMRIFTFYFRPNFIYNLTPYKKRHDELVKILHDFTDSVIMNRREEVLKLEFEELEELEQLKAEESGTKKIDHEDIGAKKKMAFLDVLLRSSFNNNPLTNMDIREEVDTFMFEGHDTTSSGLGFCLYSLAKNPDIQQKAYEEAIHILGTDSTAPVTINLLNDLNYLEMVIKETLRLYPSVPLFGRKMKENTQIGPYLVPKGANVGVCPYFMARDPTLWEDPLKFDPERFSSNKQQSHPYLYTPFSAGPRNCVGQKFAMLEMKTTVSKVLRHFELSVMPGFEPVAISELILRPENGIWLQLKERKV
ncbi:unnamed protein product [Chironomus riparius]|uniref:Cytochrome P450 n=1 Tax=Chironomus riparius TaxID=315576 RepID=A0A9N9RWM4_9DIPT|nr:unnamed protein product [Chironomus riparius]